MTNYTKTVKAFEQQIVTAVNQCGLPPIVCDLVLTNVLNEVRKIEEKEEDPKPHDNPVESEVEPNGVFENSVEQ